MHTSLKRLLKYSSSSITDLWEAASSPCTPAKPHMETLVRRFQLPSSKLDHRGYFKIFILFLVMCVLACVCMHMIACA